MTVVVKIGGTAAEEDTLLEALFRDVASVEARILIVHGGGKRVSELSRTFGIEPKFSDGVRVTTVAEMPVVDMGLAGLVNTKLVRIAVRAGLAAIGVTGADGGAVTGEPLGSGDNVTARPDAVDPRMIERLLAARLVPIMAPVASDSMGRAVNINADDVAGAVAAALRADALVFLSDIPGVLDADRVIDDIAVDDVESLIVRGVASGGMAAKLRACVDAINDGVKRIAIGRFEAAGDLEAILDGRRGSIVHG